MDNLKKVRDVSLAFVAVILMALGYVYFSYSNSHKLQKSYMDLILPILDGGVGPDKFCNEVLAFRTPENMKYYNLLQRTLVVDINGRALCHTRLRGREGKNLLKTKDFYSKAVAREWLFSEEGSFYLTDSWWDRSGSFVHHVHMSTRKENMIIVSTASHNLCPKILAFVCRKTFQLVSDIVDKN